MNLINKLRLRKINTYQFEHIEFKKLEQGYDCRVIKKEKHIRFPNFRLPKGLTEKEAFKVLSYMYQQSLVEVFDESGEGLVASEEMVMKVLVANLKDYGFDVLDIPSVEAKTLYNFDGDYTKGDTSKYRAKGCDWYTEYKQKEIKQIYAKNNLVLPYIDTKSPFVDDDEFLITK